MNNSMYTLEQLNEYAKNYTVEKKTLPIFFNPNHYVRTPIHKDEKLEIVVICFGPGQTSSIHDHQGNNCVIRVVQGRILEQLFKDNGDFIEFVSNNYLETGNISGLDGIAIHQIANVDKNGSVLINFYSPPS